AYTFTQTEFLGSFESDDPMFGSVTAGDEIPYVPEHQLSVQAGVEHHRAGGNVGVTYVAAMREQAGQGELTEGLATDEQVVVNVSAWVRLLEPLVMSLNVRNLLDAQHIVARRPFGARPNAPRWVQLGAKGSF